VNSGATLVRHELPGAPVPGGPWETACLLVRQYGFAEPRILCAVYRTGDDLRGRDMLLRTVRRAPVLLGVRITIVTDETRDASNGPERV
jgi:hypothetical protein